ncbi:hypothetical protein MettiDRAFT_1540 [Methanolobus tindarius DSM 2278]|uniref:Uncharacterized protein n=1 Tax=Methanolobus tindarius DSM 2278 TaxID=1090322 RepID=W9DRE7_METTI|nr:hypothetical protein MettiDRAFT_1540 [Methanolobus tindarius DSM 2278]
MPEKLEDRVFAASPLPPVLHGVRLRDTKAQDKAHSSCEK